MVLYFCISYSLGTCSHYIDNQECYAAQMFQHVHRASTIGSRCKNAKQIRQLFVDLICIQVINIKQNG